MLTPVYDSDITTTHKFEQKIEEARRQYKNRETIVCNTKEELLEEIMAPVQGPDTRNL